MLLDTSRLRRLVGLRLATLAMAVGYAGSAIAALAEATLPALFLFIFGLYAYLLSFTFYTPLINDIAPPKRRGRVSGYGVAANYLGQIVALAAVLPLSTGEWNFFGGSPRAETLLPATLAFALLALPMLVWFKGGEVKEKPAADNAFTRLFAETRSLFLLPGVALFFLAYFLANDAILTTSANFSIFLEQVWAMPDATKTVILLGVFATTAIGGLFSGALADRFGHKRIMILTLSGWLVIFPLLALVENFALFAAVTTLLGFWFGAHWTVSRTMMAYLAPVGSRNLAFSYFSLAERASSFLGPLVWGLIATGFMSAGDGRYRLAMLAMTAFIVFALLALWRVKGDRA